MKVKYIGKEKENFIQDNNDMDLIPNKMYDVISVEKICDIDWYRVIDESKEDYVYPHYFFEIVEE